MARLAYFAISITAATILIYSPCIHGDFIWDDVTTFVTQNPLNLDLRGLIRIWTSFDAPDYWPITYTAFWLEWRAFGTNPLGYHCVNVALHIGATLLLRSILQRLDVKAASAVALLFAVHPLNVECVAWISQQKTLLATALMLAAALCYVQPSPGTPGWTRWHSLSLTFFTLGLAAKTSIVTFPVVLTAYEWMMRPGDRRSLLRAGPFFVVAFIFGALTLACNFAHETDAVQTTTVAERFANAGRAAWFYAEKTFFPVDLCFVYPRWRLDPHTLVGWSPTLAWLVVFGASGFFFKSWGRSVAGGVGWFLIMLLPASGLIDIYFLSFAPVSDHYAYQSIPGLLAVAVHRLLAIADCIDTRVTMTPPYRVMITGSLMLLALVFSVMARSRAVVYHDAQTLWEDTLSKNPASELAHNNLGAIYRELGQDDKAIACFVAAEKIDGQIAATATAKINRRGLQALRLYRQGHLGAAAKELDEVLTDPEFPGPHLQSTAAAGILNLRGKVASLMGDSVSAAACYAKSLQLLPEENREAIAFVELHDGLSHIDEYGSSSYAMLSHIVTSYPGTHAAARAHHLAGELMRRNHRLDLAAKHFQAARKIEPAAPDTLLAHAVTLRNLGMLDESRKLCARLLELVPDSELGRELMHRLSESDDARAAGSSISE